jgi:hypothetical protein
MNKYLGYNAGSSVEDPMLDKVTLLTWGIFIFSLLMLYWFGRFTLNLIKQHRDIYSLLFELEEEEKRKQ